MTLTSFRITAYKPAQGLPVRSAGGKARGATSVRKSRSASAAVTLASPVPSRRDDSLVEKQDGVASAIAHTKESLHRGPLHL